MHKDITKQVKPYQSVDRLTRIEDIEPLACIELEEIPEIIITENGAQVQVFECTDEDTVLSNIAATIQSAPFAVRRSFFNFGDK